MSSPQLSVVIPSYNSLNTIEKTLNSIFSQDNGTLQVIVVDSSDEKLPSALTSKFPQVKFIFSDIRLFAGTARNLGAKQSHSENLCFLDSDCLWNLKWLESA